MRVFFPLILLYGLILWGVASLLTHKTIPWSDPRFTKIGWRLLLYPAVLLTLALLGFAGFSHIIDYGNPLVVFVIPLGAVCYALAILKLALVMVGDLRRVLSSPSTNKEIRLED